MIITIAGDIGSGKTTVSKIIAIRLGFTYYCVGLRLQEMAREAEISVNEFYQRVANDPSIDQDLDCWEKQLILEKDDFVLDSCIGFFWPLPLRKRRVNIFLTVEEKVGGERVHENTHFANRQFKSVQEAIDLSQSRIEVQRKRYKTLYGIQNYRSMVNFDLIIDTTHIPASEVASQIIRKLST